MLFIKIYHGAGVALLGVNVCQQLSEHNPSTPIYLLLWLVYCLVFLGVLRQHIWSLRLSLIPIALVLLATLPFTAYNFWAFISGHPLYRDSPATIFIVAIFASATVLPALVVLIYYWRQRLKIFAPRQKEFKALATYMSELSEQGYFVHWMRGLEYDLWHATLEGPFRYGYLHLEDEHIEKLKRLSNRCDGWVTVDEENEEHYVSLKRWGELYAKTRTV